MTSSGIKRGVAATAITALAVAGLPFFAGTASAQPIADDYATSDGTAPVPNTVEAGDFSIENPDQALAPVVANQPYTLVAGSNDDVSAIRWEFAPDSAPTTFSVIGTSPRVNGGFEQEWTPTASGTVRATPLNQSSDPVPGAAQTQTVVAGIAGNSDTATIGGDVNQGVWSGDATGSDADNEDYSMAVTGTTSLTDTSAAADDGFRVRVETRSDGAGTAFADVMGATAPGTFAGALPLSTYTFRAGAPDEIIVGAEPQDATGGTDGARANVEDAAVKTLYLQTLKSVTAVAANSNLQPGQTTDVTVTVLDQNDKAIAGADVYRIFNSGTVTNIGTTDGFGKVVDSGRGQGNYRYFVNAPASPSTGDNTQTTFDANLGDKNSDLALATTVPTLTSIDVFSRFGSTADIDEVDPGTPFTITAKDQNGQGIEGQNLQYTWTVDPFAEGQPTRTSNPITAPPTAGGTTTPPRGTTNIRMADTTDFTPPYTTLPDGVWTLRVFRPAVGGSGRFDATPVDFKFGESKVIWTPADAQAPLGGSTTLKGTLQLSDGTAFGSLDREGTANDVDRNAGLSYAVGTEQDDPATPATEGGPGDSRIAPQGEQDSTVVTVAPGGLSGQVKLNAAGVANVKVNDANPETLEELDAMLTADPQGALSVGDGASDNTTVNIDFLKSVVAQAVTSSTTEVVNSSLGEDYTPGRPAKVTFNVKNADGRNLSGKSVAVTVANGAFITDCPTGSLTTAQQNGVWANKGATGTASTDGNGNAAVCVAIERNAGFDDNFLHTVSVTGSVDGKSSTQNIVFNARDAVDLQSIEITPDEDNKADLPDAQVKYEQVEFDIFARDQFGNLSNENYTATDDTTRADIDADTGRTQALDDSPVLTATARMATVQTITVSTEDPNGAAADGTQADSADPINWYEIDFDNSTFTLNQEGSETVPVGTTVTEVLTVTDQRGQAIEDLCVDFLRGGPGNEDSDGNNFDLTDKDGQAFYDFVGGTRGTATITAVAYSGDFDPFTGCGDRIGNVANDTVTFGGGGGGGGGKAISPRLKGKNNGALPKDKLKAFAPRKAAGATVALFKIKKSGKKFIVATKTANDKGNAFFRVKDRNGRKKTTYRAKYRPSPTSNRAWTNKKTVR